MNKVMVIGWDSSDFRLIMPWIKEGYLPNLERLMSISKHGILKSINPPLTPIAWSTIVTGRNPGKHGISGFMSFRSNSYETYPVNAADRHGKDVWELLSDYGKKVAVIGVPMTYPVRQVNGCMISGFLTPNESVDYCYPKELKHEILSRIPDYALTPPNFARNFSDFSSERYDEESVSSVFSILKKHIDTLIYIAREKEWDFFMGVFNETDWVQHRFWSCIDKNHPKYDQRRAKKYENVIRDVHILLDEALGQLLKLAEDANVILISDHGAEPLHWNISTNYLLYKMRRLSFKRSPQSLLRFALARLGFSSSKIITILRKLQLSNGLDTDMESKNAENNESKVGKSSSNSLSRTLAKLLILSNNDVDWSKSVAFARTGYGELFLNRVNIFPEGIVKESEYMKIRSELIEELKKLSNNGNHALEHAYSRDDLVSGQYLDRCPDIQLQPAEGYAFVGGFTFGLKKAFNKPEIYSGQHSMNGIFVLKELGFEQIARRIKGSQLWDIVPTILHLMQVPTPMDLDGRSLADNTQKPPMIELNEEDTKSEFRYSRQEEEDIENHLRSLGYI